MFKRQGEITKSVLGIIAILDLLILPKPAAFA